VLETEPTRAKSGLASLRQTAFRVRAQFAAASGARTFLSAKAWNGETALSSSLLSFGTCCGQECPRSDLLAVPGGAQPVSRSPLVATRLPRKAGSLAILAVLAASLAMAKEAPDTIPATVQVDLHRTERSIDPFFMGMGVHPGERSSLQQTGSVTKVRETLGLKSLRFPNGCEADRYGWLGAATNGFITVDEFLDFCDNTGCRPYYTINLQGGTDGKDGPIPPAASLDEKIRYKHLAPNPCGYPPTSYHYGTLAETVQIVEKYTVQRLLDRKTPILDYELGNENWGQATSDWPYDVYVRTVEVYARAMREVLQRAKTQHPDLPPVTLRLTAVGYPIMGNNQDPQQATRYDIDTAWTQGLNRLHEMGLVDAVQEHFYPYSTATGDALVWVEHNLNNILLTRQGTPNPRLRGYADPKLAYNMPIEITEWNIKCWGPEPRFLKLPNGEFETGLTNWTTETSPPGAAEFQAAPQAARRGKLGLRIATSRKSAWAEARQTFPSGGKTELTALMWIRTDSPTNVSLNLRNGGQTIMERTVTARNRWQRYSLSGKLVATNAPVEIVLRVGAPRVTAFFDNLEVVYYDAAGSRSPLSVNTFEQQLFFVDGLRQMLERGVQRTFLHHLFGSYGCPVIAANGNLRDNAQAFHFFAGRLGTAVLKTDTRVETFDYDGQAGKWASDFNALAPATQKVPCLSALATRDGDRVHLLLLNRSTDRTVKAKVRLPVAPASTADIRTLTGEDYNAYGAVCAETTDRIARTFVREVAPHSAQMISFTVPSQ
jgi:hypothetical protein